MQFPPEMIYKALTGEQALGLSLEVGVQQEGVSRWAERLPRKHRVIDAGHTATRRQALCSGPWTSQGSQLLLTVTDLQG